MESPLERSVREHVTSYVSGEASLDELKDWLVGATWNLDEAHDPAATELVYEVKLALADESSGLATSKELVEALTALVVHDSATIG